MTIEDQHKLMKWLGEDKVNRVVLEKIDLYWKKNRENTAKADHEVWESLIQRISETEGKAARSSGRQIFRYLSRVAAVLIIGLVTAYVFIEYHEEGATDQVRYLEKVSLNGQKINIQLADGSKVKLNAGSKLITPERFTGDTREVELEGEAFFDVIKDVEHPFIIRSGDLLIRVHGTSFNVRAYPEDNNISVSVESGSVSVISNAERESPVLILPEQMVVYDRLKKVAITREFDPVEYFGWRDKQIVFKNSNIDEIFSRLTRWYGVSFQVNKSVDKKKDFSGFYNDDPSLEEVLKGISFVYEFDFDIKKNVVVIK